MAGDVVRIGRGEEVEVDGGTVFAGNVFLFGVGSWGIGAVARGVRGRKDMVVSCEGATRRVLKCMNKDGGVMSTTRYTAHLHLIVTSGDGTSGRTVRGISKMGKMFRTSKRLRVVLKAKAIGGIFSRFVTVTNVATDAGTRTGRTTTRGRGQFVGTVGLLNSVFMPVVPTVMTDNFLVKVVGTLSFVGTGKFLAVGAGDSVCMFTGLFDGVTCAFLRVLVTFSTTGTFNTGRCLKTIVNVVVVRPSLRGTCAITARNMRRARDMFFKLCRVSVIKCRKRMVPIVVTM